MRYRLVPAAPRRRLGILSRAESAGFIYLAATVCPVALRFLAPSGPSPCHACRASCQCARRPTRDCWSVPPPQTQHAVLYFEDAWVENTILKRRVGTPTTKSR